jgi:hypothetical protein
VNVGLDGSIGESPQLHVADHPFSKLAHDAPLSRRRSDSVDLSREVRHPTPLRHHKGAANHRTPIRRRRIEFNESLQRTPHPTGGMGPLNSSVRGTLRAPRTVLRIAIHLISSASRPRTSACSGRSAMRASSPARPPLIRSTVI